MDKNRKGKEINVIVEYTEGYQERFTKAILQIYENRIRKEEEKESA